MVVTAGADLTIATDHHLRWLVTDCDVILEADRQNVIEVVEVKQFNLNLKCPQHTIELRAAVETAQNSCIPT